MKALPPDNPYEGLYLLNWTSTFISTYLSNTKPIKYFVLLTGFHCGHCCHVLRVVPFGQALGFKDNCSFLMYIFNVFALRCICIVFLDFICTVVYLYCIFYVFADRPVVGLGRRLWIPVRDPGIGTPHCSTHICQIYFLFQIRKMQNTK